MEKIPRKKRLLFLEMDMRDHHYISRYKKRRRERERESKRRRRTRGVFDMNASSGAVPTRLGKRKVGRRDSLLWDLIVNNNDDICFTHILPRLNGTDLKFFYEVNEETRALIKRSSRKGELKETFKVEEMSSISTLEVAWEHYPIKYDMWMDEPYMDEPCFCSRVAETNKLELLKWAREEKECEWDEETINVAALQGNMEMVKYCVANECPMDGRACANAAFNGHLEVLKYLHEEAKAPWDWRTASAADNGHLHILEYLVERKYDKFDEDACAYAAREGHLDCLKYLRETAKAPWDSRAVREAHENDHTECVQYLLDNDCPLPDGWRYEHGTLYDSEDEVLY
jgi:hypothetical protein